MKITLLTYEAQGDVEPFAELGKGLIQAGHRVTLAAPGKEIDILLLKSNAIMFKRYNVSLMSSQYVFIK